MLQEFLYESTYAYHSLRIVFVCVQFTRCLFLLVVTNLPGSICENNSTKRNFQPHKKHIPQNTKREKRSFAFVIIHITFALIYRIQNVRECAKVCVYNMVSALSLKSHAISIPDLMLRASFIRLDNVFIHELVLWRTVNFTHTHSLSLCRFVCFFCFLVSSNGFCLLLSPSHVARVCWSTRIRTRHIVMLWLMPHPIYMNMSKYKNRKHWLIRLINSFIQSENENEKTNELENESNGKKAKSKYPFT